MTFFLILLLSGVTLNFLKDLDLLAWCSSCSVTFKSARKHMSLKEVVKLGIFRWDSHKWLGRSQFIHPQMDGSSYVRLCLHMLCYRSTTVCSALTPPPTDDQQDGLHPACCIFKRLEVAVRKWVEPEELNCCPLCRKVV